MEAVNIDDPPGDIAMLDEALGFLGGLDSLLHSRAAAGWAAPCKGAVVLSVEVKFNILGDWTDITTRCVDKNGRKTFVCTIVNAGFA